MIDPRSQNNLNAIYEAKQKGLSRWTNIENSSYPYVSSKAGYIRHVKEVYPESPYLVKVDFEVTAQEIYENYNANEVAADEHYKNKKIAVTGTIGSIAKDVMNDPYISLQVGYLQNVNCYFSDDNNKLISKLSKGQKVTIIGKCQGFIVGTVVLKECTLNE